MKLLIMLKLMHFNNKFQHIFNLTKSQKTFYLKIMIFIISDNKFKNIIQTN